MRTSVSITTFADKTAEQKPTGLYSVNAILVSKENLIRKVRCGDGKLLK